MKEALRKHSGPIEKVKGNFPNRDFQNLIIFAQRRLSLRFGILLVGPPLINHFHLMRGEWCIRILSNSR